MGSSTTENVSSVRGGFYTTRSMQTSSGLLGQACWNLNPLHCFEVSSVRQRPSTWTLAGTFQRMLDRIDDVSRENLGRNVEALVVLFTYGKKPDAQYTSMARSVMHQTGIALQPGRWAVNFYPARRWIHASFPYNTLIELRFKVMYVPAWFPGAGFQRWARDAKAAFYNLTREPFYHVKKSLVSRSFCCCLQCE